MEQPPDRPPATPKATVPLSPLDPRWCMRCGAAASVSMGQQQKKCAISSYASGMRRSPSCGRHEPTRAHVAANGPGHDIDGDRQRHRKVFPIQAVVAGMSESQNNR